MPELTAYHNGIRLCFEHTGRVGDPLVLIAGLAADMHYWHDDFCAALVQKGFQVARFDNRDSVDPPIWTGSALRPDGPRDAIQRLPPTALKTWPRTWSRFSTRWAGLRRTLWGTRWAR
ncbi:hypothetical protein NJB1604_05720 [Mycobacterium marinum]|nr:hypothetical protein NJB1604_05720 [Mycobacterium marinum]